MQSKISGKQLHTLMIKNGKSLKESAKALGISIEEMQDFLKYENIEKERFNDIVNKLKLLKIIENPDNPDSITPAAFDLLRSQENLIEILQKNSEIKDIILKEKQDLLIDQLDKMLMLYVIIEKFLPEKWVEYNMEDNYDFIRKFLKEARGYSF